METVLWLYILVSIVQWQRQDSGSVLCFLQQAAISVLCCEAVVPSYRETHAPSGEVFHIWWQCGYLRVPEVGPSIWAGKSSFIVTHHQKPASLFQSIVQVWQSFLYLWMDRSCFIIALQSFNAEVEWKIKDTSMRPGRHAQTITVPTTLLTNKKVCVNSIFSLKHVLLRIERKRFIYYIKHTNRGDVLITKEKQKSNAEAMQKEKHKCKPTDMNKMNSLSCCKKNEKCPV